MRYLKELREGDRVTEVYLIKSKQSFVAKNGKPYDSVVLQDKSGTMDAKIWEVNSSGIEDFDKLDFVSVTGDVTTFNGQPQFNIKRARKVESDNIDQAEYLPCSGRNVNEMYDELLAIIGTIENKYLHELLELFFVKSDDLKKRFCFHSAAKSVHHGYVGGLLEHTLTVANHCDHIAKTYPIINRDLLITAAILHDIGKLSELSPYPENDYTDEGQLLGHIVIGCEWITLTIRKIDSFPKTLANELKHCIIAHHGELEYGSPKKPALIEALALSFADNLDAKMETMKEAFDGAAPNTWLGYNKLLESNIRRTNTYEF